MTAGTRAFHLAAIEAERLVLLERLEWEAWHGWKLVSDPPSRSRPQADVAKVVDMQPHWAWKGAA